MTRSHDVFYAPDRLRFTRRCVVTVTDGVCGHRNFVAVQASLGQCFDVFRYNLLLSQQSDSPSLPCWLAFHMHRPYYRQQQALNLHRVHRSVPRRWQHSRRIWSHRRHSSSAVQCTELAPALFSRALRLGLQITKGVKQWLFRPPDFLALACISPLYVFETCDELLLQFDASVCPPPPRPPLH
jgi:hypothetical protein